MPSPLPAAALPGRYDRFLILGAVCLAGLVLPLSFTAPPVAIPAIAAELGGSPIALNWMTNAFMLAFGSCLMAAGTLADTYGRKRVFSIGIVAYAVVSLLLAMAPNLLTLNALRVLQGVAAALALAGGNAALSQEFHGPARIRAFSLLGTAFGLGLAFGPSLAGWLVQTQGWRAVFLSSLAIAVLATVFGVPRMRESRDPDAARLDLPGSLSSTAMLALLTIGVLEAPERGWSDPWVLAALLGSAAMLALFVRVETRAARPMLDLSLLKYPRFVGAQLLPIGTGFCYLALIIVLPVRLIGIHGLSALDAGLMMIALSAPMLVVPFIAAVLSHRIAAGRLCAIGLLLAAAGLVWMGLLAADGSVAGLVAPMLLIGAGSAVPWGLMDGLAISVVPKERAGMAAGVFGASRVSGEGIAIAVVAAALAGLLQLRLGATATVDGAVLAQAAQRLATGDALRAHGLLPRLDPAELIRGYDQAFAWLMYGLAAATTAIAALVFALLGNASAHEPAMAAARDDASDSGDRDTVTDETVFARDCVG
ncbi:MFS transporter [Lysobacter sp. Root690]|uniref:MFS transporter n=1 Tax=Lysobacter sp. Root690 TaxID=1736588 RepID=UPI0007014461|nr:MFS transporter [Lysobacter sp. Root690]KRB07698.1 MFS transporter [Lysobacter sp. Root690]